MITYSKILKVLSSYNFFLQALKANVSICKCIYYILRIITCGMKRGRSFWVLQYWVNRQNIRTFVQNGQKRCHHHIPDSTIVDNRAILIWHNLNTCTKKLIENINPIMSIIYRQTGIRTVHMCTVQKNNILNYSKLFC